MNAFAYDVFVIHAPDDESFVQGYLLPALDLPSERVLVPSTLELGRFLAEEIERGVRSSRVTLVVLSPACLADNWTMFGEQIATYASVSRSVHGVLLPLLLSDCTAPARIQAQIALDFRASARERWDGEVGRLRAYLERPAMLAPDLPCPYPGMRPFTERDASRFFGRDVEIERIIHRLKLGEREIYIIGASGSGKSSLAAAGLVPRLVRGVEGLPAFHVQRLRPGDRPLDALAAALGGNLDDPPAAISASLARNPPATALLLVIDQLEELFAIARDDQRRDFLISLRAIQMDSRCTTVFTLRADFYGAFLNSPLWADRLGAINRIDLGPLSFDGVRMAIERPARDVGVYLQAELVTRLLDDTDREPGALPFLQETLYQLWNKRRRCLIALADYETMAGGAQTGLAFAVKEHADAVLDALTGAQKSIALRILLRLVTFGEGRADTRRQQARDALRSECEAVADFDIVLQRLVDERLLTISGYDQSGDVRVDLAHEILIQAWSTFADEIRTWRGFELRRRELEAAAAAWRARGSGDGGLLDAIELASVIDWRRRAGDRVGYSAGLSAFITASQAAQTLAVRRRRLTLATISSLAVMITALLLVAWTKADEADRERRTAAELRDARTKAEERLEQKERADREREAAEREREAVRKQKAVVDAELDKSKEELIRERDAAREAQRRAEQNEKIAQRSQKEALAAQEELTRANRELQRFLEKEHERQLMLENSLGSKPVTDLKK